MDLFFNGLSKWKTLNAKKSKNFSGQNDGKLYCAIIIGLQIRTSKDLKIYKNTYSNDAFNIPGV